MNRKLIPGLVLALTVLLQSDLSAQAAPARTITNFRPVTQAMLNNPEPGEWLKWRGNYENWGYSSLDQINLSNVKNLRLAWSYAFPPGNTGTRGMQGEPIVHDGIIYIRSANEVYSAHDATTGDLIWEYSRELADELIAMADEGECFLCPLHRGRGMAIYGDKIIGLSTDSYLFAVDAKTGQLAWEKKMLDWKGENGAFGRGHQPSGAPVIFNGVVVAPMNCSAEEAPDPCHLSGYAVETGDLLWRWYTSPTREDPMHSTWGDDPQVIPLEKRRNMSPWGGPAVDVERGLFIFGIGSSAPQQPELAGTDGEWPDRLYQGSTVALDHRTGKLVWWAQHVTDMWNDDSVFDRILVNSPMAPDPTGSLGVNPDVRSGEQRQLVVGSFSKDGIFYAYDRGDGTFMYARPTGYQNIISSYDGRTGAYRINPETVMGADLDRRATVCSDSRTIPQGAYSPLTNAYYVPAWNGGCRVVRVTSLTPSLETGYNTSGGGTAPPNPVTPRGQPEAIDVATGKTLWKLQRDVPMYGMLTTGGGLLFTTDQNRRLYALDQRTGETAWSTILGSWSFMAPISYSVNGKQYVAVISPGGSVPSTQPGVGHTLFVFSLPSQ